MRFKAFPILITAVALLPSAVLAEQFMPEQLIEVMTKSPSNRDVRVQDAAPTKKLFVVGESATPSNRDVRLKDEATTQPYRGLGF